MHAVEQMLGAEMAQATENPLLTYDKEMFSSFQQRFARWTEDTTVMPAFYEAATADGLLTFMSAVADDTSGEAVNLDIRQNMLENLQTGLETCSTVWPTSEAHAYATALVESATSNDETNFALAGSKTAALSYLLYDGEYATPFLTKVGEGLDQYERVEMDGTNHLWSNRMASGYDWMEMFPYEAGGAHFDPMAGLMSAFGNNAEASLEFFSAGDGDDEDHLDDRQKYYIHDRTWTHDGFVSVSEALLSATTDPSIMGDPESASQAADLVVNAVNMLGHRDGIGFYDAGMFGTDIDHSSAASENFAKMLTPYMYGVDFTLQGNDNPDWDAGHTADGMQLLYYDGQVDNVPIFNEDSLNKFIALAGGSPEGLAEMRTGLNDYTAQKYGLAADRLEESIDPATGQPDPDAFVGFQNAYLSQGAMEGTFVNAIGDSEVARAKGEDETRQAWVDLASGVVGTIPVTKLAGGDELAETVISFAVDQASSAATDAASEHFATAEERTVDEQNSFADQTLNQSQYNVFSALADTDLLPPQALDGPWAPHGNLVSYEEFQELSAGDQSRAMALFNSADTGGGNYYNLYQFEGTFNDQFRDPFGD